MKKEQNQQQQKAPTFWGVKLNEEEIKTHHLSYETLAQMFDAVLCNNISEVDPQIFDNLENGDFSSFYIDGEEVERNDYEEQRDTLEERIEELQNEIDSCDPETEEEIINSYNEEIERIGAQLDTFEEIEKEVFQWYIVSSDALWYLKKANELVFYSPLLDCYIWGVCHWGTAWAYVLTDLKISDDFSHLED